jgi:hypothetical protein
MVDCIDLVIGLSGLLYVAVALASGLAVWRWAWRVIRRRPAPPPSRFRRRLLAAGVVITVSGAALLVYAWRVEPYWPQVTHVRLAQPGLPEHFGTLRIVHISDLHCDERPRLEGRLPEIIRQLRPDVICYTGDSINSRRGLPIFRKLMTELAAIAPVYGVRGNWDVDYWDELDLLGGTGAYELDGRVARLWWPGGDVYIVGVPVRQESLLPSLLGEVPAGAACILLYHSPDMILNVAEAGPRKPDLYLAGHTHGGQVALPFYGAILTLSDFGKRFESGLHRVGSTWLYVNRGIGMEGGPAPRVRFCARPEITLLELYRE